MPDYPTGLTLEELERRMYANNDPAHALLVRALSESRATQDALTDAYDMGYAAGKGAGRFEAVGP